MAPRYKTKLCNNITHPKYMGNALNKYNIPIHIFEIFTKFEYNVWYRFIKICKNYISLHISKIT